MLTRRFLLTALPAAAVAGQARAASQGFAEFLAAMRTKARRAGVSDATLDRAFADVKPNEKVLKRDRHQPEFTMTWAQYRNLLLTDKRISAGLAAMAQNRTLFRAVQARYRVSPGVISGIWGLESSFGTRTGDFHVVEALATLGWGSRRTRFFRAELLAALKILQHGDVTPAEMTGSYAGAMGQPQFMPTSYLRYAVDFEGTGRRNIWTSRPDVLASIANYLSRNGWRSGESWGQPVALPTNFQPAQTGREHRHPLKHWAAKGIRPIAGRWKAGTDTATALLLPDGVGGDAFLVYPNFTAIRRYNPSNFYALVVGLLGDSIVT